MKLGYFAMPMHPEGRDWADTLREDREAVLLADRLGYHDAFIGEHLTDRQESITNSMIFLATLIPETTTIKLGTGTTNLSHMHPVLVAAQAAMFDHLSGGRMILGISAGALRSDAEILGNLDEDLNKIFADAIQVITALWETEPPYDLRFPGNRFEVSTRQTLDWEMGTGVVRGPLQQPRPEIVGTVVAPYSKGVIAMGEKDFHPFSANFLMPKWLRSHWEGYTKGKGLVGATADPTDWRIGRSLFVADSEAEAREYGRDGANSPYRFYYEKMLAKMKRGGRLGVFKESRDQTDDEVTLDHVLDRLVICGTPSSVAEQVLALREETGDFGELVYAGTDWTDPARSKRSMELMATKVMPEVNAAISSTAADVSSNGAASQ